MHCRFDGIPLIIREEVANDGKISGGHVRVENGLRGGRSFPPLTPLVWHSRAWHGVRSDTKPDFF